MDQRDGSFEAARDRRQCFIESAFEQVTGIGDAIGMGAHFALEHENLTVGHDFAQMVVRAAVAEAEFEYRAIRSRNHVGESVEAVALCMQAADDTVEAAHGDHFARGVRKRNTNNPLQRIANGVPCALLSQGRKGAMARQRGGTRLLIYSHDSFGLGHLRRCRAIANSLVGHRPELSVLILSGSPIIGNFDFRSRVDFVRIPGVIKLRDGDYTALSLDMSIEELMDVRAAIIKGTAEAFEPDIFLVDKEPLGLRGEVRDTLEMLNRQGVPCVLGLRDVMDDPELLSEEWERKNALPALRDLYDDIWVYGMEDVHDPLAGLKVPVSVRRKMTFTGYLRRSWNQKRTDVPDVGSFDLTQPYLLCTTGGGGDGAALIDWVLRAYESDARLPLPALLVLGPFMSTNYQSEFMARVDRLNNVNAITFDTHIEALFANATAVVGMGGYNTFCEVLSFDKPSLIVPRRVPRLEQFIRAERAEALGLSSMLVDEGIRLTGDMVRALHALCDKAPPSLSMPTGLLDGLSTINGLTDQLLDSGSDRDAAGIAPLRTVP